MSADGGRFIWLEKFALPKLDALRQSGERATARSPPQARGDRGGPPRQKARVEIERLTDQAARTALSLFVLQ
jgi:hypothetical protein